MRNVDVHDGINVVEKVEPIDLIMQARVLNNSRICLMLNKITFAWELEAWTLSVQSWSSVTDIALYIRLVSLRLSSGTVIC